MTSPAHQYQQHRAALASIRQLLQTQPETLITVYEDCARELAAALTQTTYRLSLQLPQVIYQNGAIANVPGEWLALRTGSFLNRWRRRSCHAGIVNGLSRLRVHPHHLVSSIAELVSYLTAQHLLHLIANPDHLQAFDIHSTLIVSEEIARQTIQQLCTYVAWLRMAETLYPAWNADDLYDDLYARLTAQLAVQGRALALYDTRQIVEELCARWQSGEIIRGLTLFIPYLDEREYRMSRYELVVIPTGRIAFRPEFIVGASRVAQRDVRTNTRFSQATRWQLISQLDMLIQAFESLTSTPL